MTLRSSRTLPGQSYRSSERIAASDTPAIDLLLRSLNSRMNACDEQRQVVLAVAQRRQPDREHVQPVDTGPRAAGSAARLRAARRWSRRSTRMSTDCSRWPPSGRNDRSCSTRSSLACVDRRHLGDLVEEQRAAVRQLERARPPRDRAGERALLVAEQLGLEQRVGNRRAVERDERLRRARTQLMDASARPAPCRCRTRRDEHGRRRRRRLLERPGRSSASPGWRRSSCRTCRARAAAAAARAPRAACRAARTI